MDDLEKKIDKEFHEFALRPISMRTAKMPTFLWKTMEGDILTLDAMTTSHVFMCAKMLFNHLAVSHGGRVVGTMRTYSTYLQTAKLRPESMIPILGTMIREINLRGDLDPKFQGLYNEMLAQLLPQHIFLSMESKKLLGDIR